MKVFYTGNSPYARRARLAARVSGLGVEEVDVAPLDAADNPLRNKGPGVKVPGFETDTGAYFCETLLITNYLNEKSGGKLFPSDPVAADKAREVEGIGSLLLDSLFIRSQQLNRLSENERSPSLIAREAERAGRCYDALNKALDGKEASLDAGAIAVVCALGYADWRLPEDNWRAGRSGLAKWFDAMHQKKDVESTKPIF
ncbi:MAG: glutathione S-transferase N-terminal domain-containing protein [Rhodospirillales bacterium]